MRSRERNLAIVTTPVSHVDTGRYRSTLMSIIGCLSVWLTLATGAWAQGEWLKTWVMADDASLAGLSAMAISDDSRTGSPLYHFVYEKIAAANVQDRRLYYRRYTALGWEDEVEVSNRLAQPAELSTPDEGISYLPSIITDATTDLVYISARVDCTTTPVPGRSSFPSCAGAAVQLEEIIVDPVRRTYTAMPIDLTHPIAHERGLSQMSSTSQAVYCCWRVQHDGGDREVYCAQRGFTESAWGPPTRMTGGRAGEENHGYLLHPAQAPPRLSFTSYQAGGYADPKAVVLRLDHQDRSQPAQWITMSNPQRQGDFSWLAEDSQGGLHMVWQEADVDSDLYAIWHGECPAGTTDACRGQRNWDRGAGPLSPSGGSAKYPQILITPSDDVLVAYQQQTADGKRIQVSYRCHGSAAWQHVTPDGQFDDQELWLGEPAFVQDLRGGEVHVVYRVTNIGPPERIRLRWARHAYPDCSTPPLTSLACAAPEKPDFAAEGVIPVPAPVSGTPLLKRTLTGADARCNDGSPAVMYLRPALAPPTPPEPSPQWIIHFQGGRSCTDAEDCRARWCSEPPQQSYGAGKMSTRGVPPAILSEGIFSAEETNTFRSYNHVFVYYCSSDNWLGAATPQAYTTGGAPYLLAFHGAAIVDEVIRTLQNDAGTWSDPLDGGPAVWLPDLDRATEVLFTGSSAGSIGLRQHVDRLHAQLLQDNPQVLVRAVIDVGFLPSLGHEAITWHAAAAPESYEEWLAEQAKIMRSFWQTPPGVLDASCLQQLPPAERLRCLDTAYVLQHHVTTPFFVSQDLTDNVWWRWLDTWHLLPDASQLAQIVHDELLDLQAPGFEPRTFTPGLFGPNCRAHELLPHAPFFAMAVGAETLHTTLYNWLHQQGPAVVVESPSTLSYGCPVYAAR